MQNEREPLDGIQRVEHHEQRETDRVGQQCLLPLVLGPLVLADIGISDPYRELSPAARASASMGAGS